MQKETQKVCLPLPSNLTKCVTTCKNSEQYLINFLQNLLPPSDGKSAADELRKTFIFSKLRSKTTRNVKINKKFLTTRKRMLLGLGKISCNSGLKYTDLLPLHQLWLKYIQSVLGDKFSPTETHNPIDANWENINQQLMKADFHGAKISVVKSKCPSLVGISGIIVQDTKNTFRICGMDNIMRTLPKDAIVIKLYLHELTLQIFGKQLSIRPTERTVKKFKTAHTFEL
ncbi:hypothetical protein KPH14_012509 [Odynerus spinipes]|uniref:Ribonuclease P protein subunit p29 n=1 Tax=Odynerus spinipes TaxID=1348599 RepID=A0AAD9RII3_9HYME|nr:hypothetical protein KPH14_012509 [Odynerus spinipes]